MKKYNNFINENLSDKQEKYIELIINYLKKNSDLDLFPYDEEFDVNKKDGSNKLIGKLFFIPDTKAVRFNFDKDRLVSVDMWEDFEFEFEKVMNKPTYEMLLPGSIMGIMDDIIDFINGDFDINESKTDEPTIKKSPAEDVKLGTLEVKSEVFDEDIDVFESVKIYSAQVAYGISNSLVISGAAGLGKTFDVEQTLNDIKRYQNIDYLPVAGDITTAGLFEVLFINRDKLIVFDDMDSVYKSEESVNLLKAVLDTKPKRKVSRIIKTHFDSFNMTDEQIQTKYNETGKLPKQFEFTGRIIFITNKAGDDLDEALISRSLFIDINPPFDEVVARINKIKPFIKPEVDLSVKDDVVNFMVLMAEKYEIRFPLNLRTFVHCLNIRFANEYNITVAGEQVPVWQMLIKQYLVKKVKK